MKNNQPPPFCINCKHFIPSDKAKPDELMAPHRCSAIPMICIVTGTRYFLGCDTARSPQAPCGENAALFAAKHEPQKEPLDLPIGTTQLN